MMIKIICCFFICLFSSYSFSSEIIDWNSDENLKRVYSIAGQLRRGNVQTNPDDAEIFFSYVKNKYKNLPENVEATLSLFKNAINYLDDLQEDIIESIHKNQRQEIENIETLPIGIIQSHPLSREGNIWSAPRLNRTGNSAYFEPFLPYT